MVKYSDLKAHFKDLRPSRMPAELKAKHRWAVYRVEEDEKGRKTKVPYIPPTKETAKEPLRKAKANDPSTWTKFGVAWGAIRLFSDSLRLDGLLFAIDGQDDIVGIDVDYKKSEDDTMPPEAEQIFNLFVGKTYLEFSPSRKGFHVFLKAKVPPDFPGNRKFFLSNAVEVEVFVRNHFISVTGWVPEGGCSEINECQGELDELLSHLESTAHKSSQQPSLPQSAAAIGQVPTPEGEIADLDLDEIADLVEKIRRGDFGEKVRDLFEGRWEGLYPSQSEADLAFCSLLARLTRGNAATMDAIFRLSGLHRPKWDERHSVDGRTYGAMTIEKALTAYWQSASEGEGEGESKSESKSESKGESKSESKGESKGNGLKPPAPSSPATQPFSEDGETKEAKRIVDRAIAFALSKIRLFKDPNKDAWAMVPGDGFWETLPVDSEDFAEWLQLEFWDSHGIALSEEAKRIVQRHLSSVARRRGVKRSVFVRVGFSGADFPPEKIFIDLGDEKFGAIEMDKEGWRIVPLPEDVPLYRPFGMWELPEPERAGKEALSLLRCYLPSENEDDFILIVGYLLAALSPRGPYPILEITGEAGTGKTTLAKFVRWLIDPNGVEMGDLPQEERDFFIAASNSWLLVYDNISTLNQRASDMLCRMSTGGGFRTRKLYTNKSEVLFYTCRPIILSCISPVADSPDLRDRIIRLHLKLERGKAKDPEILEEMFKKGRLQDFRCPL